MFTTFSDINMKHIKDALLEVFDEIPEEKEKLISQVNKIIENS